MIKYLQYRLLTLLVLVLLAFTAMAQPSFTIDNIVNPDCSDDASGSFRITIDSGTGPDYLTAIFSLSTGAITLPAGPGPFVYDNLIAETYTVVVRDLGTTLAANDNVVLTLNVPVISGPAPQVVCDNVGDIDLLSQVSATPDIGTWSFSGNGVTGNNFNPLGLSGIQTIVATYTTTDCPPQTLNIIYDVSPQPDAGTGTDETLCEDETAWDLFNQLTGNSPGGTWSDDDGSGALTGSIFDASAAGPGTYNFTYTVSAPSCPAEQVTVAVTVDPLSVGGIIAPAGPSDICEGDAIPTLTLSGQVGDVLRWERSTDGFATDITDIGNAGNATLDEVLATNGTYSYRAVVQSGNCAASFSAIATVVVNIPPNAGTATDQEFCETDAVFDLNTALTGADAGGVWRDETNTIVTNSFDPSAKGAGVFAYTYTVSSPGCPDDIVTVNLTVSATSVGGTIAPAGPSDICEGDAIPTLILSGQVGDVLRWERSTDGFATDIIDIGNAGNATLDEVLATAGTYSYRAVVQSGNCVAVFSAIATVVVNIPPNAGTATDQEFCETDAVFDLNTALTGADAGGVWRDETNTIVTNSFDPSAKGAGVFAYTYTVSSPGCPDDVATVNLTVSATSVGGIIAPAGPSDICEGDAIPTLTLSGQVGDVLRWERSTDGFATDITDIGNAGNATLDEVLATAGTYSYRAVVQSGNCAAVFSAIATVVVNIPPSAGVPTDQEFCVTDPAFDLNTAISGADAGGVWRDETSNVVTNSFDPAAKGAGTYAYTYTVSSTSCPDAIAIVNITVNPEPVGGTIDPVGPTEICDGATTPVLTLSGETGTVLRWERSSDDFNTNLVDLGNAGSNTFSETLNGTGTYTYRAIVESGSCGQAESAKAVVEVIGIPGPPTPPGVISEVNICLNEPSPTLTATGTDLKWYKDQGLVTLLGTGPAFTPDPADLNTSVTGTTSFFVTDESSCGEGLPARVDVVVQGSSPAPTATSPVQICVNAPLPTLTATGTNLVWYSDAALTTQVGTGPSYTPSAAELDVTTENTTFFYVTQDIGCGESSGTPVEVGVFLVSPRPLVFTTSYDICVGAASPTLFAVGFNLKWYSDINLTNQVGSGLTFTPGPADLDNTVQATTSFFVSQDIGCGESLPVKVDVSVIVPSPPPVADSPVELCLNDAIPTLSATGTSLQWYTDGNLVTPVGSGTTYTPDITELDVTSEGTTLFFVTQNQGCGEGPADTVSVSVNTSSPAPLVSDPVFTCQNSGAPTISATGVNLLWYTDDALTNLVWAGNNYVPTPIDFDPSILDTTTFYVTQEIGCGQSPGAPVRVIVQTDATQPPVGDTLVLACLNAGQPTLSVQGTSLEWYSDPGLINLVATGNQFTPDASLLDATVEGLTSFYVIQNTACGSSPVLEVVVNVFDCDNCFDVTVDATPSQCSDDNGSILLTRSVINGSALYLLSDGTNMFSQDNGLFTGLASGTYNWEIIDEQGCSENGMVEVTFLAPVVSLTVDNVTDEACIGLGGQVEVTITGGSEPYQWSVDRGVTWTNFSNGLIEGFPAGTNPLWVRNDETDVCVDSAAVTLAPGTSNLAAEIGAINVSVPDLPTGSLIVQNIRGGFEPYETRLDLVVPIDPEQSLSRDWAAAQFNAGENWFEQSYTQIFAGEYEVGVRDDAGCEITLTAIVDFDPDLFIPTVFTPNNDGFNDTFFVRNLPASGSSLIVSNRWGRVVYESSDYRNDWTGEGVAEGVYYYSFNIEGSKYSGTVELWRGRN